MNQIKRQHQRQKKPKLTFTLSIKELAHGLEIIQALEPSYHPVSLNQMVKLIYQDYLAKMSIVSNPEPRQTALNEVKQMLLRSQGSNRKIVLEEHNDDHELIKIIQRNAAQGVVKEMQTGQGNQVFEFDMAKATEEPVNESERNIVTDFSPLTMEELNEGGEIE